MILRQIAVVAAVLKYRARGESHTVTRTTQNEALPWKITDLGIEEAHLLVPEHFVPRPYWYLTFLHAGNVFLL